MITAKRSSTATCVSCSEIGGVAFAGFEVAGVAVGAAAGTAIDADRVEVASGDLDVRRDLVPEVGYLEAGVRVSGEL